MRKGGYRVKQKNEASGISILIGVIVIVLAVVGAVSLHHILPHLNGWQAAAYSIVAGIFIALIGVIVNSIVSFFRRD
jgi:hypothetical protein